MRSVAPIIILIGWMPAYGWGPVGHSLVARIAYEQLKPEARARVKQILAPDQTLVSIASWADEVRRSRPESAPWHYIDIPIDQPRPDMARDCPNGNCVIVKIDALRKTMVDANVAADERREALMYLVHFIGDMHQPLHCSDHSDRGGNTIRVQFFERQTNLHSVWDSGLIGRMGKEDQLFAEISPEAAKHAKKWAKGSVADWAEQSHRMARKVVYAKLPKVPEGAMVPLSVRYAHSANSLLRVQLAKAGVRLAAVLNADLR